MNLLTLLPVIGALGSLLLSTEVLDVYLSPLALITVFPGVLLIGLGRWWCGRLIRSASHVTEIS